MTVATVFYISVPIAKISSQSTQPSQEKKKAGCGNKPPAGRKTRLRAWQLLMRSVESAFALLLTKVTKHIPPQTSPVGSSLAGIWSVVGRFLCKTLYYNLHHKASGKLFAGRGYEI